MGQYFSDGPIIPYGMIMEYNNRMYLCKFYVVEDINVSRNIHLEKMIQKIIMTHAKIIRNVIYS